MKIFKYPLRITDKQTLLLPSGAQVLTVQTQHGRPCIWALVDEHEPQSELWAIDTYGTGHELPDGQSRIGYAGTYQIDNGALVFHVFINELVDTP